MKLYKIKQFFRDVYNTYVSWQRGFHREEKELVDKYYIQHCAPPKSRTPQVVMMLDGRVVHGGLADRLRGICSVYDFCKHNGIDFRIHFVSPFPLSWYLEPNKYDWTISEEDIIYDREYAQPVLMQLKDMSKKFHQAYLRRRLKERKQLHVYSNTLFADKNFKQNFDELFKLSQPLEDAVSRVTDQIGGKYAGIAFRFQSLLGDFTDMDSHPLAARQQEQLMSRCAAKIDEMKDELLGDDCQCLLATGDSGKFLHFLQQGRDYIKVIPGDILHIDYTEQTSFDAHLKTFVDMLVQSRAQRIVLFRTGKMYKSGFAKRAAAISGICFRELNF